MANHRCCSVTNKTLNYACLLPAKVGISIHDAFPVTHQLTSEMPSTCLTEGNDDATQTSNPLITTTAAWHSG